MTYEDLEKKLDYLNDADRKLTKRAFLFAEKFHKDQKRNTGEPFVSHELETAAFIADLKLDAAAVSAALIHDVCEDTPCDLAEIRKNFGRKIAYLVDGVTKLGKIKIQRKWLFLRDEKELKEFDRQAETLRKMFMAMAKDVRVVLIKLADRYHNMKTLHGIPEEKQLRIAKETLEIYAPLAYRLGMGELKGKLEDLAFPYVYPDEYKKLKSRITNKLQEKSKYIEKLKKILFKKLAKAGIRPIEIHGRTKHMYSLWLKLKRYDNDLKQIYDLVALRIIVKNVEECYKTFGLIHHIWLPLLGRTKDYIANPKPNGYQSLHTTVFAQKNEIVEIQIRTQKMHDQAENGIAAHWHYAENKGTLDYLKRKVSKIPRGELTWIKELVRWQKKQNSNREVTDSLGIDFFSDRIFVYTPQGDVKNLPLGATAIDFAYAIHTDVGNALTGAKINGKITKLSTPLKNGDIVEIIKSKKPTGPKQDWLEMVKTSLARTHIRHWLKTKK